MLIQLMSGLSRGLANRIAEIAAAWVNGRSHRRAVAPESAAPRQESFSELTQQKIGASGTGSRQSFAVADINVSYAGQTGQAGLCRQLMFSAQNG